MFYIKFCYMDSTRHPCRYFNVNIVCNWLSKLYTFNRFLQDDNIGKFQLYYLSSVTMSGCSNTHYHANKLVPVFYNASKLSPPPPRQMTIDARCSRAMATQCCTSPAGGRISRWRGSSWTAASTRTRRM